MGMDMYIPVNFISFGTRISAIFLVHVGTFRFDFNNSDGIFIKYEIAK